MSRIADVLAELGNLGAVGDPTPPARAATKQPPSLETPPPSDETEEGFSGEEAVELLTAGFRAEDATEPEPEEEEELPTPPPDAPSIEERLDIALQEVEAIADVVNGLKNSLLGLRAELLK